MFTVHLEQLLVKNGSERTGEELEAKLAHARSCKHLLHLLLPIVPGQLCSLNLVSLNNFTHHLAKGCRMSRSAHHTPSMPRTCNASTCSCGALNKPNKAWSSGTEGQ